MVSGQLGKYTSATCIGKSSGKVLFSQHCLTVDEVVCYVYSGCEQLLVLTCSHQKTQ